MTILARFSDFLDRATLLNLPQKTWTTFSVLVYGHFALGLIMFTFGVICFCLGMEYSIQYSEVNCSDGMNVWVPLTNLIIAFTGLFAIKTLHMRWPAVIYCAGLFCSLLFTLGSIIDLSFAAGRWFGYVPTARDHWAQSYAWMDIILVVMGVTNGSQTSLIFIYALSNVLFSEIICIGLLLILRLYWLPRPRGTQTL